MTTCERLLLLTPKTTYRADDFLSAADRLGVEVVVGIDRCHALVERDAAPSARPTIAIDFRRVDESLALVLDLHRQAPILGVVALDDQTTILAATVAAAIGLPHNSPKGARAARDKLELRSTLSAASVWQPRFASIDVSIDADHAAKLAAEAVGFPCVVKPRSLSASRGVIRATH